ncbi:MAG: cation:proton antiporter [Verrucomicrobiota bacterium]
MTAFTVLMLAAALAFGLAKVLKLPPIPLLMISGIGLRLLADQGMIDISDDLLREMTQIGLAMLVFTAGAELSPRRMRGRAKPIAVLAISQFFVLGTAGFGTALLLDYSVIHALYIGCALSASSTLVVVRQLQQRRQMFEPYGRLVLGVLLLQDAFIVLLMVALLKLPDGAIASALGVLKTMGIGVFALGLHKWLVPWITQRLQLDDEELMLGSLAVLFTFAGMAYLLDIPFLVGAFFAGFALSAFPMNGLARGLLGSLSAFFLALFFISIGAFLSLPSLETIGHSFVFIAVLLVVTIILVSIVAELLGYSTRAAVESGILLSQTSEFSLLLALTGLASGQIGGELFSMIALITVTTMTLTPFIARERIAWSLMKIHPRYKRGELHCETMTDHAVLLGYGRAGARSIRTLQQHGIEVVVIDDDAAVIRKLIEQKIPCLQGDGSDKEVLKRANCRRARVVLSSMRRSRDVILAINYLKDFPAKVVVNTFEHRETEQVRAMGGYPVETSQAAAESLLNWMEANLPKAQEAKS